MYDSIKQSNSSLKRRPKKVLEDCIDRVLVVLKEEQDDSDSVEGDFEGLEEENGPKLKVCYHSPWVRPRLRVLGTQYHE